MDLTVDLERLPAVLQTLQAVEVDANLKDDPADQDQDVEIC